MSFYGLVDGSEKSLINFLDQLSGVDQVGAESRAAMLATRSIKTSSKKWAIETAISMVDLTTLEGADTPGKIRALCSKAVRPDPTDPTVPSVGAVCVYNDMVEIARTHLDAIGGKHGVPKGINESRFQYLIRASELLQPQTLEMNPHCASVMDPT